MCMPWLQRLTLTSTVSDMNNRLQHHLYRIGSIDPSSVTVPLNLGFSKLGEKA